MDERSILNGSDNSVFKPYLVNGEYILWTGKPGKKKHFTGSDIFMIPFSLAWCGFALFWEFTAITSGAPIPFVLFGSPFVLIGLYLVFGRFIHASYLRKNTDYAITNKKIIRKCGRKTDILHTENLPPVYVDVYKDGYGTIQFGQNGSYNRGIGGISTTNSLDGDGVFSIENIPDVINVEQIITNLSEGNIA